MMGTFSPYYSGPSYSTYSNMGGSSALSGNRDSVKQVNQEASQPLYRNNTPTSYSQASTPQKKKQSKSNSNMKSIQQISKIAKQFQQQLQTQKAINSTESYQVPMDTGAGNPEVYATPELQVAPEAAGAEIGTEAASVETMTATGEGAGLVEAGVAAETGVSAEAASIGAGEAAAMGYGTETAAVGAGEGAAAGTTAAEGTTAASASSGMSATGIGAIIAAIAMAEHYANSYNQDRYTDPSTGELSNTSDGSKVRTNDAFGLHFATDPGMTALLKNDSEATVGEKADAAIQAGDTEDMAKTAGPAVEYWANPAGGIAGMAAKKFIGGDAGDAISNVLNPVSAIFSMV